MTGKLFAQAMGKFFAGIVLLGVLIFLPAGTLLFRNGWLLMEILFIPMFLAGIVLMIRNPELLKKRLQADEKEPEQRQVILLSGLMFLLCFVLAGLNFRFRWIVMPRWTVLAAAAVFLLAYLMYGEVLRENIYLSRRFRKIRRWLTPVSTGSSAIPCILPRCSCSWPCRWCWGRPCRFSSCWGICPSLPNGSGMKKRS